MLGISREEITPDDVKQWVRYHHDIGMFFWLRPSSEHYWIKTVPKIIVKAGDIAGYLQPSGYIKIHLLGRTYETHRLAWYYQYGVWPKHLIDHINRVKWDNRIENLRDVTHSVNRLNRGPPDYSQCPIMITSQPPDPIVFSFVTEPVLAAAARPIITFPAGRYTKLGTDLAPTPTGHIPTACKSLTNQ